MFPELEHNQYDRGTKQRADQTVLSGLGEIEKLDCQDDGQCKNPEYDKQADRGIVVLAQFFQLVLCHLRIPIDGLFSSQ